MSQILSSQGKNAPSNPYPHYLVRLATSRKRPFWSKCPDSEPDFSVREAKMVHFGPSRSANRTLAIPDQARMKISSETPTKTFFLGGGGKSEGQY